MKRPCLLAHRGFSEAYPENSPLAFQMAAEKTGADGIESDVHITRDGELVIFHDASVERTSNGTGFVKDHTYEEMLALDIGGWKSPEFAGQHIWTLGQLLDFCREAKLLLNLELKNYEVFYRDLEQRVIDEICQRQMQDAVFVSSFNHISMQRFKELCPDIETGLLYDKPLLDMEAYIRRSNADSMHPRYMLLQYQPELVELYHSRGMKVNTWTVNDGEAMEDMMARGVDCIISNRPDLLCRVADRLCGK
nr:glycerophosphodiester phosphodiesterase family protein [uncultured Dysosmobacter sp.]